MMRFMTCYPGRLGAAVAAGAVLFTAAAHAALLHDIDDPNHRHDNAGVHENGIGPDPDRDTNPATDTRIISFITDDVKAGDSPPYNVVTFEPPPGKHGEAIRQDYTDEYGLRFGRGLTWQICEGQRRFYYDTMCTYEAPPSGKYAAGYLNYLNIPLLIEFDRPVCVVTMSIYPTGAKEDEPFEFAIQGWTEDGQKLTTSTSEFTWTNNTVRWRNMAGAYFIDQRAAKITVSMHSKDRREAGKTLRYLIDDFAYVDEGCEEALKDIKKRTGVDLREEADNTGGFTDPLTLDEAYLEFVDEDDEPCHDEDNDGVCDYSCDRNGDGVIDDDAPDQCYYCDEDDYEGECAEICDDLDDYCEVDDADLIEAIEDDEDYGDYDEETDD